MSQSDPVHIPVLLEEVLKGLDPQPRATFVDGTAGAAGHTRALADRVGPEGRVIGMDRDAEMLKLARQVLDAHSVSGPVSLYQASYHQLGPILDQEGIDQVDGVLLDLGLSSDQLAWSDRGFSFVHPGPLDMRFNPDGDAPTAAELLRRLDESRLANLIYEYGEERFSRRIARRIVQRRQRDPLRTTTDLAELVASCLPRSRRPGAIHPATRTFQALRIAVNGELERLDAFLNTVPDRLVPGGRLALISFHSLEDRRVKIAFREDPRLEILTRKPITASEAEQSQNPRSRSAKLRVAQRCLSPQ